MTADAASVKTIFSRALEMESPDERSAYLDEACRGCPEVRAEVDELLRAHHKLGSFLNLPAGSPGQTVELPTITERPGTIIGRYKLLQQIGEGGFGVVFMADQLEPVRRKVALKIIKPGMDTKEVIARFEAERQALALMDHPNIAKVFDGGETESGRPYFVMELVKGIPITDYCDQVNLTTRDRLDLFNSICHAVQHAHQKGIIHRDIKPKNVLITLHDGTPVVKVIDFGISKAIDQRLTERTLFTEFGQMIGTPMYMSPEQAEISGLDVDTRTDIYSLGVLLYELLTGVTPFDTKRLREAAHDEIRRIIREEDPPMPSKRISTLGKSLSEVSAHRKTEPRKLSTIVSGDLDWIVMKAVEKDRTRRYATAKDFADDIQHYLTDQPVEARAPSTLYRFQKFVRRYRAATATIAAIAATFIAATVFSTWMAVREVQSREQMQIAKEEAEGERQHAEEGAEKARKAAADAELSFEVIGAGLEADGGKQLLGSDHTVSEVLQRLASRLDTSQDLNFLVKAKVRIVIAKAYLRAGKNEAAETQFRRAAEAIPVGHSEVDDKAGEPLLRQVADTWVALANAAKDAGMNDVAELAYRNGVEFWQRLTKIAPLNTWYRGQVAFYHWLLGEVLEKKSSQIAKAEHEYRRAIELLKPLTAELPKDPDHRARLVMIYRALARLLQSSGRSEEASSMLGSAVAFVEGASDADWQYQMRMEFGNQFRDDVKLSDAKDAFSHAMQLSDRAGANEMQRRHESSMALSDVLFKLRDWQGAETVHRKFLLLAKGKINNNDLRVAEHRAMLVCALAAQGKEKDAESIRQEGLSAATPEGQWQLWTGLGNGFYKLGRLFDAKDAFSRALKLSEGLVEQKIERQIQSATDLWSVLVSLRDAQSAEVIARQALRFAESKPKKDPGQMFNLNYALGITLEMQEKKKEAQEVWLESLSIVERARKDGPGVYAGGGGNATSYADSLSRTHSDEATLQKSLRILKETSPDPNWWARAWWHGVCAEIHKRLGKKQEAIQHQQITLENVALEEFDIRHYREDGLMRLLRDDGQFQEAETVLRKALGNYKGRFGDDHVLTNYARADLAEFLVDRKNYKEAEDLLQASQKSLLSDSRVPAIQQKRIVGMLVKLYDASGKPDQATIWRGRLDKTATAGPTKAESPRKDGK